MKIEQLPDVLRTTIGDGVLPPTWNIAKCTVCGRGVGGWETPTAKEELDVFEYSLTMKTRGVANTGLYAFGYVRAKYTCCGVPQVWTLFFDGANTHAIVKRNFGDD